MDQEVSYGFKEVKRMRRDDSATCAIIKQQQQQKNRQPLAAFKSNKQPEINNQSFLSGKVNNLGNEVSISTQSQGMSNKENVPNLQLHTNKLGPTVPQTQKTFRIFVDDDISYSLINQSQHKHKPVMATEGLRSQQQKSFNKENILPQMQPVKIEPCLPLAPKPLCIVDQNQSSAKVVDLAAQKESTKTVTSMDVAVMKLKPSLASIPPPEAPNAESPMVVSPDRNVSSESVEKPQSNKRKATSVLDVDVYADDIHSYLRKAEYFHRPKYDYMERQCDVNGTMRSILVDWLVEVSEEYKLRERTLYLAISYIDRFLSAMSVRRSKLQLVGTAALFIAAKFQEIYPPDCAEFAYITDDTYNIKQVLKMESLMLKVLSFNLSSPTAVDFLERYGSEAGLDSEIRELSMYLTELTLKDYGFLQFMPSLIAVSAVSLALHTFKLKYWPQELSTYTNYQWQQVSPCLNRIFEAFRLAHTQPQRAVVEKYKSPRHHRVSLLKPPISAPI